MGNKIKKRGDNVDLSAALADLEARALGLKQVSTIRNIVLYRAPMDFTEIVLGQDIWAVLDFLYYQQPNFGVANARLPDIPVEATALAYLYFYQSQNQSLSLGASGISDVPQTWRNGTFIYRLNFERTRISSAQQTGIALGIEREILAGMSKKYTNSSASSRIIDFASASSGANDPLDTTDLIAAGWVATANGVLTKSISAGGAAARTWRILHNT